MPLVYCAKCGEQTSNEYSNCTNCGSLIDWKAETPKPAGRVAQASSVSLVTQGPSTAKRPSQGLTGWLFTPLEDESRIDRVEAPRKLKKKTCGNCGLEISPRLRFCQNCGRALSIDVPEVLNSSLRILKKYPLMILPLFLEIIITNSVSAWIYFPLLIQLNVTPLSSTARSTLLLNSISQLLLVTVPLGITIGTLVHGMYPFMVRRAMEKGSINLLEAFRGAMRRFASVFMSQVLIFAVVFVGALLLVVPGIVFSTWYFYATPAVILEDRGALAGMSASKAFARDKKWETFAMMLAVFVPTFVGSILLRPMVTSLGHWELYILVSVILSLASSLLSAVAASYTYITYAMRKS